MGRLPRAPDVLAFTPWVWFAGPRLVRTELSPYLLSDPRSKGATGVSKELPGYQKSYPAAQESYPFVEPMVRVAGHRFVSENFRHTFSRTPVAKELPGYQKSYSVAQKLQGYQKSYRGIKKATGVCEGLCCFAMPQLVNDVWRSFACVDLACARLPRGMGDYSPRPPRMMR